MKTKSTTKVDEHTAYGYLVAGVRVFGDEK